MSLVTHEKTRWDVAPGRYYWNPVFSNFDLKHVAIIHPTWNIIVCGPTGEHVYQASKAMSRTEMLHVLRANTPGEAKKRGRRVDLLDNWDGAHGVGVNVMYEILYDKVNRYTEIERALEESRDLPIIEVTRWQDRIWGTDLEGNGLNQLGQLWMVMRSVM